MTDKELQKRLAKIYAAALQTALDRQADYLEKVKAVREGRIKPHEYYDTPEKVERWKQRFLIELARQQRVIDDIAKELAKAGRQSSSLIKRVMPELYEENRQYVIDMVADSGYARELFSQFDRRQINVILEDSTPPFSKIAYNNLGKQKPIVERLGAELAVSLRLGESQDKLVERIQRVAGQSLMQARRVAQTERGRVQAQARDTAINEAASMGVRMEREWRCRHVNSRDAHMYLHGKYARPGEPFVVDGAHDLISTSKTDAKAGGGYEIMYPHDPTAPARAVINCHCVLVPHVLLPGEESHVVDQTVPEWVAEQAENVVMGTNSLTPKGNSGIISNNVAVPLSLRFLVKLDQLAINAKKINPLPGYEDIVVHGDKTGFEFKDYDGKITLVNVHEFAMLLKQSGSYHRESIRLISCETGADGATTAQLLANDLGVNVLAPTDVVWVLESGEMIIGPDYETNSGEWRLFKPERK